MRITLRSTVLSACALTLAFLGLLFAEPLLGPSASSRVVNASSPTVSPRPTTVCQFLEQYWGARWPGLKSQLSIEQVAELARRLTPEEAPDWNEIAVAAKESLRQSLLAERHQWIQHFTTRPAADVCKAFGSGRSTPITDVDVAGVQLIIDRFEQLKAPLAVQIFDLAMEANETILETNDFRLRARPKTHTSVETR